ncbi:MAG: J domain-containing protein [Sphingomicrobium sp.]|nr:J domain-containing protein [Sphingomonadales bacterium]
MEVTENYYAILRVAPDAGNAAIRAAYLTLMRRYHPDVNRSDEAVVKAKAINEAYACLRDALERSAYDRQRIVQRTIHRAAGDISPWPPQRTVWSAQHAYVVPPARGFQPTWWKAGGLGLATLFTILTFTATSATPPSEPPRLNAVMNVNPKAVSEYRSGIDVAGCKPRDTRSSASYCRSQGGRHPSRRPMTPT